MRNPNISVSPSENSSNQKGLSIFEIGRSPCKTTSGMLAVVQSLSDSTSLCVFSDQKLPDMPPSSENIVLCGLVVEIVG